MIKIFRNIRQTLIMENKTSKYLKYAIGEIVLVMIGILLALQVNNWNESRKTRAKEIEILKDFQISLQFEIIQIDSVISQSNRAKASIKNVLNHLENDLPYSDSLDYEFFNTACVFFSEGLNSGVYETLKSTGFNLISNKEIRDLIILVYDEFNTWIKTTEQLYINNIFDAKRNMYKSRFMDSWNGDYKNRNVIGTMKPLDYEKLKTDNDFKYYLRTQINDLGWLINYPNENAQVECKKLLRLIEAELSTME